MDQTTKRLAIVVIGFVLCFRSRAGPELPDYEYGFSESEVQVGHVKASPSEDVACQRLRGALRTSADNGKQEYKTPTYQKYPWDGIPKEEVGHPLVQKGFVDFIDDSRHLFLENLLDEFLEVYAGRPDWTNLCGMRINHSYSLFLAIRHLQPTSIIENGVNAGHSTYIMRAAAPRAKIYPIDPLEEPICNQGKRWVDEKNSEYFTGTNFKDFADVDWEEKIRSG